MALSTEGVLVGILLLIVFTAIMILSFRGKLGAFKRELRRVSGFIFAFLGVLGILSMPSMADVSIGYWVGSLTPPVVCLILAFILLRYKSPTDEQVYGNSDKEN